MDSKIYVFLSASNEVKPAITCKNCNANVIVNPLTLPTTVHLIKGENDGEAVDKLKIIAENRSAIGLGNWILSDLLKLWKVDIVGKTDQLLETPQKKCAKIEKRLSKEKQLEAMAKLLNKNGYKAEKV